MNDSLVNPPLLHINHNNQQYHQQDQDLSFTNTEFQETTNVVGPFGITDDQVFSLLSQCQDIISELENRVLELETDLHTIHERHNHNRSTWESIEHPKDRSDIQLKSRVDRSRVYNELPSSASYNYSTYYQYRHQSKRGSLFKQSTKVCFAKKSILKSCEIFTSAQKGVGSSKGLTHSTKLSFDGDIRLPDLSYSPSSLILLFHKRKEDLYSAATIVPSILESKVPTETWTPLQNVHTSTKDNTEHCLPEQEQRVSLDEIYKLSSGQPQSPSQPQTICPESGMPGAWKLHVPESPSRSFKNLCEEPMKNNILGWPLLLLFLLTKDKERPRNPYLMNQTTTRTRRNFDRAISKGKGCYMQRAHDHEHENELELELSSHTQSQHLLTWPHVGSGLEHNNPGHPFSFDEPATFDSRSSENTKDDRVSRMEFPPNGFYLNELIPKKPNHRPLHNYLLGLCLFDTKRLWLS